MCTTLGTTPELRRCTTTPGTSASGTEVTVSVGVVEIYPESFDMQARIRPVHTDGIAATARCSLAHGARHMH